MLLSTKTNSNPFPLLAAFEADPWKATAEHYARCATDKILAMASFGLELEEEALRTLGIGFSDRSLGNQLPSNQTAAGRRIRERYPIAQRRRPHSAHDHFDGPGCGRRVSQSLLDPYRR